MTFLRRRVSIVAVALTAKAVLLVWLGVHGFPRTTGDAIVYQQPARMFLTSGRFSIPTADGWLPHAEEVYAANAPLYTLASVPLYNFFGFSYKSSLWFDLAVHFIATLLCLVLMKRLGAGPGVLSVFVLVSTSCLLPRGRPEELGVVFGISAFLVALNRGTAARFLVGSLLGLSTAAHLSTGSVATTVTLLILFRQCRIQNQKALVAAAEVAFTLFFTVMICFLPLIWKSPQDGVEQFLYHSTHHYRPDIVTMLLHFPSFSVFLVIGFAVAVVFTMRDLKRLRPNHEHWMQLDVRSILNVWAVVITILLFVMRSQPNHFRFVAYFFMLLGLTNLHTITDAWRVYPFRRWLVNSVFALSLLIANEETVRYALVPFTWTDKESQSYEGAEKVVREIIPAEASIGGDGVVWDMLRDGRAYIDLSWSRSGERPDYLLSTTFWGCGGKPRIFLNPANEALVSREYEVVKFPPQTGCELRVFGMKIPISRSSCDWRITVWRRRQL